MPALSIYFISALNWTRSQKSNKPACSQCAALEIGKIVCGMVMHYKMWLIFTYAWPSPVWDDIIVAQGATLGYLMGDELARLLTLKNHTMFLRASSSPFIRARCIMPNSSKCRLPLTPPILSITRGARLCTFDLPLKQWFDDAKCPHLDGLGICASNVFAFHRTIAVDARDRTVIFLP